MKYTKTKMLTAAVSTILGVTSMGAQAALVSNATLSFVPNTTCFAGLGTYPNCNYGPAPGAPGSYFDMAGNGKVVIQSNNGIILGQDQPASGTHSGGINGSELSNIDMPWSFFGNTGLHQTLLGSGGITIINNTGAGGNDANTVTLDFSNWNVTWNGISSIPMSGGAHSGGTDGVAVMTCAAGCVNNDTYTLIYRATVPAGDPSGFGGVQYSLFLGGNVNAEPVPAAVWLFGSGLIGLIGIAKRKKAQQE